MADRRGLAGVTVYRDGSGGLFQVGRGAIRVSAAALSTVPHGSDLRPLWVRTCGEHGHLCRRHLRIGAAEGKGYLAPGTTRIVDCLFDDVANRLYCRSPRIFLESGTHRSPPHLHPNGRTVLTLHGTRLHKVSEITA